MFGVQCVHHLPPRAHKPAHCSAWHTDKPLRQHIYWYNTLTEVSSWVPPGYVAIEAPPSGSRRGSGSGGGGGGGVGDGGGAGGGTAASAAAAAAAVS